MATRQQIEDFFAQPPLAVVGASRSKSKFGYLVYQSLKEKGIPTFAVNPNTDKIEGDPCYPTLRALPEKPGGIVLVVPPDQTEKVVREAHAAGIRQVWMQPGAESAQAIVFCQQNGISVIAGECVMMHSPQPKFPHSFHRWFNKISGKLPR
jgi:predicted CoA-binding protein